VDPKGRDPTRDRKPVRATWKSMRGKFKVYNPPVMAGTTAAVRQILPNGAVLTELVKSPILD